MDIPWYSYFLSALGLWLAGFISGRASGQASTLQAIMLNQAKAMQMPGLPPNLPGPGGR